ncbi:MAG: CDP-archaeol synthase [Candidatus Colwellbacteria bacterium]|nr:CDP-archaeol synthase [Candidatus Colwellbacteria bacterium]
MEIVIQVIWLLLPAAVANICPVIFRFLPILNYPVDFGKTFNGKPILGRHKTYRGFLVGILGGILTAQAQKALYPIMEAYSIVDYSQINIFIFGFALSASALLGDTAKSFLKRRLNIAPGKPWIPFDQIDWIVGSLIAASFWVTLNLSIIVVGIFVLGTLHFILNLIGYATGLREENL